MTADRTKATVSYEAFMASGLVLAEITPGNRMWVVQSQPALLEQGALWTFRNTAFDRTCLIRQMSEDQLQIEQTDANNPYVPTAQLNVVHQGSGFALSSIAFSLQAHTLKIAFQPSALLPITGLEDNTTSKFTIMEDDQVLAHGEVLVQRAIDAEHLYWQFDTPAWARSETFDSGVNLLP